MLLHHSWWCLFQHHRQISPFYRRNKPRPTGIHTPLLDAMERLVIFKTFSLFSVTVRSLDSTCCFPWPLHLTRMNSRKWYFWPSTDNWDKWHGTAMKRCHRFHDKRCALWAREPMLSYVDQTYFIFWSKLMWILIYGSYSILCQGRCNYSWLAFSQL